MPNVPSFLEFKQSEEAVLASRTLQHALEQADRKVQTSTHLNGKQVMSDLVLPCMAALVDWSVKAQSDLVRYQLEVAEYLTGGSEPQTGLPESVADDFDATLNDLAELLTLVRSYVGDVRRLVDLIKDPANTDPLVSSLVDAGNVLLDKISEAHGDIEEAREALSELTIEEGEEEGDEEEGEDESDAEGEYEPILKDGE